jgi:hypothetical protein
MTDKTLVSAEVLLRESSRAAGEKIAQKLTKLGFEVLSVGSRSVSVQGPKQRFESVFGCRLLPSEKVDSPARDFGPLGGSGFRTAEPPKVPSELQDEVESVEIQQPPLLF